MARYVLVEADGYNKEIMGGPFDVDDPSQVPVPEGERLMSEEEAFAEGYHYAEGGGAGVAAGGSSNDSDGDSDGDSEGQPSQSEGPGRGHRSGREHGRSAEAHQEHGR